MWKAERHDVAEQLAQKGVSTGRGLQVCSKPAAPLLALPALRWPHASHRRLDISFHCHTPPALLAP